MANSTFGTNILPKNNTVTIGNSDSPWKIVSPDLTGTPTAPTAAAGTNTTQVATTAFVNGELSNKADKTDTELLTTLSRGRKANTTVGALSIAYGYDITASGDISVALGSGTTASGAISHAEGASTIASGADSHAEGCGGTYKSGNVTITSEAAGIASHTEGYLTRVISTAKYAHAEGNSTSAEGESSHVEGASTTASGTSSHAEGSGTKATQAAAHAEGGGTTASGTYAHAEGASTTASANCAHAEGGSTTASGIYSHAEGSGTTASGQYSHAEGSGTTASGQYSHAEGYSTEASEYYAHAEGYNTSSSGYESHAEGYTTTSSGSGSHAEGCNTEATSDAAHAEGCATKATSLYAHAEGYGGSYTKNGTTIISKAEGSQSHTEGYQTRTTSSATGAHAEGKQTSAEAASAHAEGELTVASGTYSHAEGYGTTASQSGAHAEGYLTTASGYYAHAEGLGGSFTISSANYDSGAKGAYDHVEGSQTRTESVTGDTIHSNHAEGYQTVAFSGAAHAEGYRTQASGKYSHSEGNLSYATAESSHAEGYQSTASAVYSHAEGENSTAGAYASHAEGYYTTVSGQKSHAEGDHSNVSGTAGHAEGNYGSVSGNYGHAEGDHSSVYAAGNAGHAEGYYAEVAKSFGHAEGEHTYVLGVAGHAEGSYTDARGNYSHSAGLHTYTAKQSQYVIGEYNDIDDGATTKGDFVFIAGNGTATTVGGVTTESRSNAYALGWNGTGYYKGDVYVGCNADSSGGTKLATVTQLADKVDKVSGKGLSTEDYTTEEKTKLEGIATGATANTGTITGITMNGASKGTSGVVDLGTVITSHQDISGKADKTATVSTVSYDTTNKKLTQTINGTESDIVTAATLKTDMSLSNVENKSSSTIRGELTSGNVTTALGFTPIDSSLKGANSGIAELDATGKVPSSQLPSFVDDVLEYDSTSAFPTTGETGKIYIAKDTNKTYRWGSTDYVEISASLALGETSATAYRGDRGKTAYDHASAKGSAFTSGLYKITTNAQGHVTAAASVEKSDITALGIPAQDTTYESKSASSGGTAVSLVTTGEKYTWNNKADTSTATTTANGLMSSTDKIMLDGMGMVVYGTCNTAAATAAKTVTISNTNWQRKVGSIVCVKFDNSNSASNVTLDVNGTGAASIYYSNAVYTSTSTTVCGTANTNIFYMFDGTYWVWLHIGLYQTNTKNSAGTTNKADTKMFLVGGTSQSSSVTTYSNSNCYIGTDNCLYSGGVKVLTSHQDISGKVDINQGSTHAGEFLMVNSSGNVEPVAMSVWQGGSY